MNWKGQPLVSMEMIINLIGNTTSQAGLKVYAMEDQNTYQTKRKISDGEMKKLNMTPNKEMGKWNYVIKPSENK